MLVVGPSGCGKSSLVRAGLLPVLASEPGWRTLAPILPGPDPVAALARELAATARRIGLDWTVEHVHQQLDARGLRALADELLVADPDGPQRLLLIVVNQFEELLIQAPPGQRARFAQLLRPALAGPVQVVATLRPEFLDQLLTNVELADLPTQTYTLRPLHREALRLAIEGPARLAGLDVDEHLVARLVDDTDTGEALPLLAFTLAQLTDGVSRGGQLSATRYDQLGGVQGALIRQADAALAAAVSAGGRRREEVIAGLLRLVTVDEQGRPTRWRVNRAELPEPVLTELDTFVTRRLVTTDTDNGTVVIGVAHEAFLSAWPPLAEAIAANVTALRARRAVEHAATEWYDDDRPPARLWGAGQLAAIVADTGARICASSTPPPQREGPARWLPHRHRELVTDRVDLSPKARDFLHTSIRHDRHRRRRTVTVLSVLLILALVAAGVAIVMERDAQKQQRIARQLIAQADALRDIDPRTALRLGVAAHHIQPGGETHASLVNLLTTTPYAGALSGYTSPVDQMAFTADGHTLATASRDHTIILWDLTDRIRPTRLGPPLTGHTEQVTAVAFTTDGHTLATASLDGTVIVWDVTDRARPVRLGPPLTGHTKWLGPVTFTADGHTLAIASTDGTVTLWDLTNRAHPTRLGAPLTGHTEQVTAVAFTTDGRTLATASLDGTVIVWDVTDRARPVRLGPPLTGHTKWLGPVTFTADGHTLAIASNDGTVTLWDLTNRAHPTRLGPSLTGHTNQVTAVAFTADGHTLATASIDGTVIQVILWDVTDQTHVTRLRQPTISQTAELLSAVAFTADGTALATASYDGIVTLWDLTDRARPTRLGPPLTGHTNQARSVALTADGSTLATGSDDGTVIVWDVTDRTRPHRLQQLLTGHADSVFSVAFTADRHTLATASTDGTVTLWDVTDRARPTRLDPPLAGHTKPVRSVTFTADGTTLATGSDDGTVIVWDVTDRTRPRHLGQSLTDHVDGVTTVAFTADGHTLVTGSNDRTVIVWDVTDRARPTRLDPPLTGHTAGVSAVAFTADSTTLATASFDGHVILWDFTALNDLQDHTVERICAIAGGGLDREEWARYIPALPYQGTCSTST